MRIGIDVGGTHTDAVVLDRQDVIASTKVLTSENVRDGVVNALDEVLSESRIKNDAIEAVMVSATPSLRRLKTRSQFLQVAATRRKWVTPGLILQARRRDMEQDNVAGPPGAQDDANTGQRAIGVGFTVSRKVGNAVARNRAKRRLRAAATAIIAGRGAAGEDYVLIGRKTTLTRPYSDLMDDLAGALDGIARKKRREAERKGR